MHVFAVCGLLAIQAALLAYSATVHSPTHLEPAFLAAGVSHWHFGRFELYRVNPPLPRLIAAIPVVIVGCETNWRHFDEYPGSRAEFLVGRDFVHFNKGHVVRLFIYARLACIPFFLVGGYFVYMWSKELYGDRAALFSLVMWTFEPNLLAHAELITPDSACVSFGIFAGYSYWKWLKQPSTRNTIIAGIALGLAQLSKMSWLILFVVWPAIWLATRIRRSTRVAQITNSRYIWLSGGYSRAEDTPIPNTETATVEVRDGANPSPRLLNLMGIILIGVYIINLGYFFDDSCTKLGNFTFVSSMLAGKSSLTSSGNRFAGTLLGELPIPLPKQFVLGFDTQRRDFEQTTKLSYLHGTWKTGGWWYYYAYGLLIKLPCGTLGIILLVIYQRSFEANPSRKQNGEAILVAPLLTLFLLASSQTAFSHHLRYVFPSVGLMLVFLGQGINQGSGSGSKARVVVVSLLAGYTIFSSLMGYPHHLSYFNEIVGGPKNGGAHLLGSSCDWGQDLLVLSQLDRADATNIYCGELSYEPSDLLPGVCGLECLSALTDAELDKRLKAGVVNIAISAELMDGNSPRFGKRAQMLKRLVEHGRLRPFALGGTPAIKLIRLERGMKGEGES